MAKIAMKAATAYNQPRRAEKPVAGSSEIAVWRNGRRLFASNLGGSCEGFGGRSTLLCTGGLISAVVLVFASAARGANWGVVVLAAPISGLPVKASLDGDGSGATTVPLVPFVAPAAAALGASAVTAGTGLGFGGGALERRIGSKSLNWRRLSGSGSRQPSSSVPNGWRNSAAFSRSTGW